MITKMEILMKYHDITQYPLKIYGLVVTDAEARKFYRLPEYMLHVCPNTIIMADVQREGVYAFVQILPDLRSA